MASDQLEALRRAYADVILNTSREAAARVMAAERKAQQFQAEIQRTKDEAVQVMVRLKKKMDDETSEANLLSRNKQQKIDELEAQLHEAEDVVTELREKLRYAEAKSEGVARSYMQHLDQHRYAIPEEEYVDPRQSQSILCPLEFQKDSLVASYKKNPYLNQRTESQKCSSEPQMRNLYGAVHELPSIIRRSKKHNLSRNACTQRIHACERNILDNESSRSRKPDDASRQGNVEGAKKDISTCKVTFNEVHKMFNIESKEVECSRVPQMRNYDGPMLELPSIIRRSKKHNLSRNAWTQRIPACERNIVGNELSLSRQPDGASNQGNVEGAKKDNGTCKVTFNEVQKMFKIESKEVVGKNGGISCCYEVQPTKIPKEVKTATKHSKDINAKTNFNDNEDGTEKLISKGKPPVKSATKYRKNKSTSGTKTPTELFMKGHETPGVPHSDPSPESVENNPQPDEDPIRTMQELSLDKEGMETRLEYEKATETNGYDKEGDAAKLISKGEPPVNILVPSVQEGPSTERSDIQVSKSNLKKVDEPILQPMLKTNDNPSEDSAVQYFKHTFQRKRKRETVSISDGHVSADNHTPQRKKGKQIASEEPAKSSLVADLSLKS